MSGWRKLAVIAVLISAVFFSCRKNITRIIPAIVPVSGASWADSAAAKRIAMANVPAWAFHNRDDSSVTVNSTIRYVNIINAWHPNPLVRMTLWDTGGHDAWTKATDPAYREENKNIYEWMLQFTR